MPKAQPTCHLRCQEQKQGTAHDACTQHRQGGTDSLSQQSAPTLIPFREPPTSWESEQGACSCIHSLVLQQTKIPIKPSAFLLWHRISINFCWWTSPRPESYQLHSIISLLSFNLNFTNTYTFLLHTVSLVTLVLRAGSFLDSSRTALGHSSVIKTGIGITDFSLLPQGSRMVQPQTVTNSGFI